jgi:phenylalanyl-tRNA synthetase beta chain
MAYEVGAIYDKEVKPIDLSHKNTGKLDFKLNIKTENCSLFLARKVENIHISESIPEIKEKLMASGIRPINNVVDISNYVMLETGQPLHFYDADKLRGMLEVRMAEKGEKLITLDKQERTLSSEDIVISDGTRAIGLAGVMGGLDTEITENTKNVIIESAIFDNVKIRKTSNKILRSEASNRFEKGLDPNRTYMAIERACNMLEKYADGTVIDGTEIYDKSNKEEKRIEITVKNICDILGTEISKEDILDVFRKLDFKVELKEDKMIVIVPTRRMDISIKEDLIEEVGRIYGVDNIQGKTMILPVKKGTYDNVTREIRNRMVNLGLNETLSYSLVNPKESDMFTKHNKESIGILAPLTEERSYLRQSLVTSLYKIYEYNKSHSIQDIHLFEIAKTFYKESDKLVEENKLACLMTGEYFLGLQTKKVDFYIIKGIAEEVLDYLGYNGRYSFIADNSKISEDMHPGKSAIISVNNDTVGMIGRINPVICEDEVYVMEINLDKLLSKKVGKMKYKEISKFQSVKKDISILVDENIMAQDLQKAIKNSGGKLLQSVNVFDVYNGKGIPEGKKSIAFSVELGDSTKTLTDEEINAVMNKVTENLKAKFGAELRK